MAMYLHKLFVLQTYNTLFRVNFKDRHLKSKCTIIMVTLKECLIIYELYALCLTRLTIDN